MKRCFTALSILCGLACAVFNASADLEVSASVSIHAEADFYEPLSAHGAWIEVDSYGRSWHPARVAVEWRPYCYGHWVWTDCGWYWASDEPWAWACYHYGGWVYHPRHAWIWVPGIEWAPAWVSWRVGGGYVGWAPYPPPRVRVTVPAPPFVFVEVHRFHEPVKPAKVIVNNTTILAKTTPLGNIKRETKNFDGAGPQKVVINEGPGLETIQKATGKKVGLVPIREAARQTPFPPAVGSRKSPEKELGEPPKSTPERKPVQTEVVRPADKPVPPDKGKPPPKDEVVPSPERPPAPAPGPPPGKPQKPGKGKGKEKDKP